MRNNTLVISVDQHIQVRCVKWADALDAMTATRLQLRVSPATFSFSATTFAIVFGARNLFQNSILFVCASSSKLIFLAYFIRTDSSSDQRSTMIIGAS